MKLSHIFLCGWGGAGEEAAGVVKDHREFEFSLGSHLHFDGHLRDPLCATRTWKDFLATLASNLL